MKIPQELAYVEVAVDGLIAHRMGPPTRRAESEADRLRGWRTPDRRLARCRPDGPLLPLLSAHSARVYGMSACTECFGAA